MALSRAGWDINILQRLIIEQTHSTRAHYMRRESRVWHVIIARARSLKMVANIGSRTKGARGVFLGRAYALLVDVRGARYYPHSANVLIPI